MSAHRKEPNMSTTASPGFLTSGYDGGLRSGILSPALSSATSTTTTPITPMTPLTTPRTPAQALLGSHRYESAGAAGGSQQGPHSRPPLPSMPQHLHVREDEDHRAKQLLALQLFSNFLNQAEVTLEEVKQRESSGQAVLGPGIVRVCHDLADGIDEVANELRREYRRVASNHELKLMEEAQHHSSEFTTQDLSDSTNAAALVLSDMASEGAGTFSGAPQSFSREEYISTLSTTQTVLMDTANALRTITAEEAQELGEVVMEVAQMIVWSLRMVHQNMIQMTISSEDRLQRNAIGTYKTKEETDCDNKNSSQCSRQHRVTWSSDKHDNSSGGNHGELGPLVEIIGEEEKKDDHHIGTPPKNSAQRYTPILSPIPSSPERSSPTQGIENACDTNFTNPRRANGGRLRILWPPLLPTIAEASKHCAESAIKHPLPAIALGLTCGPAAVATACFVGPPVLIVDWAIQSSYEALSDTPVIENAEKGAANALQVAKLGLLCSKLVIKQGITVGEKQIHRRGGVGKICADAVGGVVDMALHPVESIGMAWDGLWWMGGAVRDAVGFVSDVATNNGGKREMGMDIH